MFVTYVDVTTTEPPDAAVYHPKNTYPYRDGVGNVPYASPTVTYFVDGETEPPFALNVTVTETDDQTA